MCDDFAEGENFEDLGIKSSISLMKIVFLKCSKTAKKNRLRRARNPKNTINTVPTHLSGPAHLSVNDFF